MAGDDRWGRGAFGVWSGVPAGAVLFAMLGAAVVKAVIWAESATLPKFGRLGIQVSLSLKPLARAGWLVIPLAIVLALLITLSLATGLLIWRTTPTDLATALWMTAPGGLMEIAVMADAMKVDMLPVLTVHTGRVVLIIAIQPGLVLVLSRLLWACSEPPPHAAPFSPVDKERAARTGLVMRGRYVGSPAPILATPGR